MGIETVLFKIEEMQSRSEIAETLRLLATKVEAGRVSLCDDGGRVDLDFPENMTVEIKAEEEANGKTKRSLEIELEWTVGSDSQHGLMID